MVVVVKIMHGVVLSSRTITLVASCHHFIDEAVQQCCGIETTILYTTCDHPLQPPLTFGHLHEGGLGGRVLRSFHRLGLLTKQPTSTSELHLQLDRLPL